MVPRLRMQLCKLRLAAFELPGCNFTPIAFVVSVVSLLSRQGPRLKGLEKVLLRWDSSTMTLTADSKGRIACRDLFPPHASFEALKEPDGRVTLIRLRREYRKPRLVKPVVRKGLLVLPMDNAELDSEALEREIREERERENARLLG